MNNETTAKLAGVIELLLESSSRINEAKPRPAGGGGGGGGGHRGGGGGGGGRRGGGGGGGGGRW